MPLFSTIFWVLVNVFIAVGLNWFLRELRLINNSEVIALYFIVTTGRLIDVQAKFNKAYKENPDLVEEILREQLDKDLT